MVMMAGPRMMVGSILPIGCIRHKGPVLMVAYLKYDFAEGQMVMIAIHVRLMLDVINDTRRAGAREDEHQRDA